MIEYSEYYKNLKKPAYAPSSKVFKYAWSVLYFLMFLSLILILRTNFSTTKIWAITFFVVQLVVNILWPFVFFKYRQLELAFFVCVILFLLILIQNIFYFKISMVATILQIPYLFWVAFASKLCFDIVSLNKKG